jgi:hypothetical protein
MFLQDISGLEQLGQSLLVICGFLVLLGHDYVFHPRALIIIIANPAPTLTAKTGQWGSSDGKMGHLRRGI